MKDSQKKKKKKKKQGNKKNFSQIENVVHLPKSKLANLTEYFSALKKQFFWIIASVTILNLLLGIGIIYLVGQMSNQLQTNSFKDINVPDLPILQMSPELRVSADSLIVYEKDSRVVVFEKNSSLRFSPASTTKIMTALIALETYELDQYLSADGVSGVLGSKMGLIEGEQIRVVDLLYGLMLPSGNDAAHVLAVHYPGGKEAFVKRMNEKAAELRLSNTKFVDPAGLEDGNYSTAFDLARLAVFAIQNSELKKIVETKYITVYDKTFTYEHRLENLNRLLFNQGVFGVKTGYTYEAGQVLVTSFESKGKTYMIVVLKSDDRFYDTEQILNEIVKKVQLESF